MEDEARCYFQDADVIDAWWRKNGTELLFWNGADSMLKLLNYGNVHADPGCKFCYW